MLDTSLLHPVSVMRIPKIAIVFFHIFIIHIIIYFGCYLFKKLALDKSVDRDVDKAVDKVDLWVSWG